MASKYIFFLFCMCEMGRWTSINAHILATGLYTSKFFSQELIMCLGEKKKNVLSHKWSLLLYVHTCPANQTCKITQLATRKIRKREDTAQCISVLIVYSNSIVRLASHISLNVTLLVSWISIMTKKKKAILSTFCLLYYFCYSLFFFSLLCVCVCATCLPVWVSESVNEMC